MTRARRWWAVPAVALVALSLWFLLGPASSDSAPSTRGLPMFANADVYAARAEHEPGPPPDFTRWAHLKLPPLPPERTLERFTLEPGFRIEIVAHEPDVIDPIAMDIDSDGRLWVVEMASYMPVHDRTEPETSALERVPLGRIVVLEDTNGDGRMDHRWVFMDRLVLPRAIKVMDHGVLIAEPPYVWYIRDTTGDGIGDTREIAYDSYGNMADYNVEHMPNGLMWGMDNWLHSSHSGVESLRYVDGAWVTRPFEQLGQWGMTQDSWGRLYSSHNRRTLTSHLAPYGYSRRHPSINVQAGLYADVAESETMWPAHTTGVNRGYLDTEVREDGTLLRSTATAGPVIYRGHQFGDDYLNNAFVPEPAGNLIKRLVGIDAAPGEIEAVGRFAYREREFLTSTDERFRPVNLYNSPDGAIYVIDMYRGIFQHARYLTDHLRDYAVEHGLHEPGGMGQFGRIYRIVRDDRPIEYAAPRLSALAPAELARHLAHPNGQQRDAAQQLLVQRSPAAAVSLLERYVTDRSAEPHTRLQALWTLEGYDPSGYAPPRLTRIALSALDDPHPRVRAAAVRILEPAIRNGELAVVARLDRMADEEPDPFPRLQLLASLGESGDPAVLAPMARILARHAGSRHFREIALTGTHGREADFLAILAADHGWRAGEDADRDWVLERLNRAVQLAPGPTHPLTGDDRLRYERGAERFATCAACHGDRGQGLDGVAPPLAASPWVTGDAAALVRITLHGLDGAARERGLGITGGMPAHPFLSDEEIASVLTYVRQSWGNAAAPIDAAQVAAVRAQTAERRREWTPDELRNLPR